MSPQAQPQPSPARSIFVSHTNDDELADIVLGKLVEAFTEEPPASGLRLVYDGCDIRAGEEWRKHISEWLENVLARFFWCRPVHFVATSRGSREKPSISRCAEWCIITFS